MTGFEYTAAVGMLYEGQTTYGLKCIENIRDRYNRRKRSPFDEAECGHHYGRAMASWSALLALSGFHYSGITKEMKFGDVNGKFFWSNGYAYGTAEISGKDRERSVTISVLNGIVEISKITIDGIGAVTRKKAVAISPGGSESFRIIKTQP